MTGSLIAHPESASSCAGEEATSGHSAIRDAMAAWSRSATAGHKWPRRCAAAAQFLVPIDCRVNNPVRSVRPIYAALKRTAAILAIGTVIAGLLAYALAHRMTEPIRLLEEGNRADRSWTFDHASDRRMLSVWPDSFKQDGCRGDRKSTPIRSVPPRKRIGSVIRCASA